MEATHTETTHTIDPHEFVETIDETFCDLWDSFTNEIAETFLITSEDHDGPILKWEGATLALYVENAEWRDWMPTWYGDLTYEGRTYTFRWDSYYRELTWKETK